MSVSPKVSAATAAAALVGVVVWGASSFGINIPSEVQAALITIAVFAAGYLRVDPERSYSDEDEE